MNMAKMYEMYKNLAGSADMASAPFFGAAGSRDAAPQNHEPASASSGANDYLKHMQSLLTPEQLQLLNNISNQQRT